MTVVDLATGEPITEEIEKPNLLDMLKQLVARVESGDLELLPDR